MYNVSITMHWGKNPPTNPRLDVPTSVEWPEMFSFLFMKTLKLLYTNGTIQCTCKQNNFKLTQDLHCIH